PLRRGAKHFVQAGQARTGRRHLTPEPYMRTDNLHSLPENLPIPQDDGACDHLRRSMLPSFGLRATSGSTVDLSKEGQPWLIVYCYPRTGRPDQEPLGGAAAWNAIPGARGCTPQSCAYRDHYGEVTDPGSSVS